VTDGISAAYRKQKHYKVIARHKWVSGTTLTESIQKEDDTIRRFTATILGWQNFKLYEGKLFPELFQLLVTKMNDIKTKIELGDEAIFESDVSLNQKYNQSLNSKLEKVGSNSESSK